MPLITTVVPAAPAAAYWEVQFFASGINASDITNITIWYLQGDTALNCYKVGSHCCAAATAAVLPLLLCCCHRCCAATAAVLLPPLLCCHHS
jgi:hypothetical protein